MFERFVKSVALVLVVACSGTTGSPAPQTTAAVPDGSVPPSTLVDGRPAPSASEIAHYEFMAGCLAEFGIAAKYDPKTGGLTISAGANQSESLNRALEACRSRAGLPIGGEVTDAYLRSYYPFLVRLYDCLVAEGLPVPAMVTLDTFLEQGGEWHPYQVMHANAAAAQAGTTDDLRRAQEVCPDDPDNPKWSTGG